jgi:hypothetical protein
MNRPWRLAACLATLLSACSGELRFDDEVPRVDGSVAPDTASEAPPADGHPNGGFHQEGCGPLACHLECEDDRTCEGSCGASCTAECDEQSTCTATTGARGRAHCGGGARCTLSVGADSDVLCSAGSHCEVRCVGSCLVTCADGATCTLGCGADAPTQVTGSPSCP